MHKSQLHLNKGGQANRNKAVHFYKLTSRLPFLAAHSWKVLVLLWWQKGYLIQGNVWVDSWEIVRVCVYCMISAVFAGVVSFSWSTQSLLVQTSSFVIGQCMAMALLHEATCNNRGVLLAWRLIVDEVNCCLWADFNKRVWCQIQHGRSFLCVYRTEQRGWVSVRIHNCEQVVWQLHTKKKYFIQINVFFLSFKGNEV